jgi:hypothetical protein
MLRYLMSPVFEMPPVIAGALLVTACNKTILLDLYVVGKWYTLLKFLVCRPELFLAFRAQSNLQNPKLVSPSSLYLNHTLHSPLLAYFGTHVRCSNGNYKGEKHPRLTEFQIL